MNKVLQRNFRGDGFGDCVQCSVATLFNLSYEEVPDMCPNTKNQGGILMEFMRSKGYTFSGMLYNPNYHILYYSDTFKYCQDGMLQLRDEDMLNLDNLKQYSGINGLFLATVLSPKYTSLYENKWGHHQVLCDSNLNIVFDPNPLYQDLVKYPLQDLLGLNGICEITLYEKEDA